MGVWAVSRREALQRCGERGREFVWQSGSAPDSVAIGVDEDRVRECEGCEVGGERVIELVRLPFDDLHQWLEQKKRYNDGEEAA